MKKYLTCKIVDEIFNALSIAAILFLIGFYVPGNREPLILVMLIFLLSTVIKEFIKAFFFLPH